jgi:hypothetical protein
MHKALQKIMNFQWNSDMFQSSRPQVLAFNGRDLRSSQVIEEGSGFNIKPAIKRLRLIFEDF